MTSQVVQVIQNFTSPLMQQTLPFSSGKIRRKNQRGFDAIDHLRASNASIRTKNLANFLEYFSDNWKSEKLNDAWKSQAQWKRFSRRWLSSSELDMILNAFLMGNPGSPSIPIAQAWTTDLNGILAWTKACSFGWVQYLLEFGNSKDMDNSGCLSTNLSNNFSQAARSSKNFRSCSGTLFPPEKFCNGDPPVHGNDMWTWQNKCTSPSSRSEADLVIFKSSITWFTRSATWFCVATFSRFPWTPT